jgi:hypothetical protein
MRTSGMHRWLLLVGYLASPALFAQDSSAVAPKWALDLYLGGGGSEKITVRTGSVATGTFDLTGWFHLGAGVDRRIAGRWSGRFTFGYEVGGWEATGATNPFAAPSNSGDRWAIGSGAVYQVYRGHRSQFNLQGGARFLLGMDVPTVIQLDSSSTANDLRTLSLRYKPSLAPVLAVAWRWRAKRGSPGCIGTSIGITYFHCTYDRVELPSDVPTLPNGSLPLTGTHEGLQLLFTIGYSGWSPN